MSLFTQVPQTRCASSKARAPDIHFRALSGHAFSYFRIDPAAAGNEGHSIHPLLVSCAAAGCCGSPEPPALSAWTAIFPVSSMFFILPLLISNSKPLRL